MSSFGVQYMFGLFDFFNRTLQSHHKFSFSQVFFIFNDFIFLNT